jgi:feruloyl esterase
MLNWLTGMAPPTVPAVIGEAQWWIYGSNAIRYLIARDPAFDVRRYDPRNFQDRVQEVSALMDSTNPDLSHIRLYVSPASSHGGAMRSVTDQVEVPTLVDLLDPLDRWVEAGQSPADALIQLRQAPTPPFQTLATRPMCRYPNYPHYIGCDRFDAGSFQYAPSTP